MGKMPVSRRGLLTGMGGAALATALSGGGAFAGAGPPSSGRRVTVIGAGIIGSSIAYHLAVRGAQVTVLEAERPSAGATQNAFAWLNAGGKRPRPYHTLNLLGMMGWHRLQSAIPQLAVQWGGCVEWADEAGAARIRTGVERAQAWGYSNRLIGEPDIQALLPGVTPGPAAAAAFSDIEGTLNPKTANLVLVDAAKRLGAKVEYPARVTGFDAVDGRVRRVLTAQGAVDTDEVVLAAGLGTTALAAMVASNVPLTASVGILAHTEARPMALARLAYGPGVNLKQNPDGGYVTGSSFGDTPGVMANRQTGEILLSAARRYAPQMEGAKLEWVSLGLRVLPRDGLPIVGHLPSAPNVYVASMHSGMTMAPLIGQLAAAEILGGPKADLLEIFRPERFA